MDKDLIHSLFMHDFGMNNLGAIIECHIRIHHRQQHPHNIGNGLFHIVYPTHRFSNSRQLENARMLPDSRAKDVCLCQHATRYAAVRKGRGDARQRAASKMKEQL